MSSRSVGLIGGLLLAATACVAQTPKSVLDQVKARGAKACIREYTSGAAKEWHAILKGIETGDSQWLLAADGLRAGSDASHSQDLEFSVATALPKNADAVLRLHNFALEKICDVPYLEASPKVLRDFQTAAQSALGKVSDPSLQERKKKCQAVLMAP
jgi:hypothetical protein